MGKYVFQEEADSLCKGSKPGRNFQGSEQNKAKRTVTKGTRRKAQDKQDKEASHCQFIPEKQLISFTQRPHEIHLHLRGHSAQYVQSTTPHRSLSCEHSLTCYLCSSYGCFLLPMAKRSKKPRLPGGSAKPQTPACAEKVCCLLVLTIKWRKRGKGIL